MKNTSKSNNETTAEFLPVGAFFEVVGMEKSFKDLRIKRVTDCSVLIEGQIVNKEGGLSPIHYSISGGSPVRRLYRAETKASVKIESKNKIVELPMKRKRGRPRKS